MKFASLFTIAVIWAFSSIANGQDLPDKIRGYKVYNAKVVVKTASSGTASNNAAGSIEAVATIGAPSIADIGLFGMTITVGAEIGSIEQNGNIDLMTFQGMRINGVAVDVEEYDHPFALKKGLSFPLPLPARVHIRNAIIAMATYKELIESKKQWAVTGTVFVFGRFKKYGFTFKRVVPVTLNINVPNPLSH